MTLQQSKSLLFDLPYLPRGTLLNFLNSETRYNLGQCSKRAKKTIDLAPAYYRSLYLNISIKTIDILLRDDGTNSKESCAFHVEPNQTCRKIDKNWINTNIYMDGNYLERAANELRMTLCHKNLRLTSMCVEVNSKKDKGKLQDFLMSVMTFFDHKLWVKSFNISIEGGRFYSKNHGYLPCFLPFFKPGKLESIKITTWFEKCKIPRVEWTEAVQLDQWKQVRSIEATQEAMEIEHFWNAARLQTAYKLNTDELKKLIKHYLKLECFEKAYFFGSDYSENPFNAAEFDLPYQLDESTQVYTFEESGSQIFAKHYADLYYNSLYITKTKFNNE